ncbi:MAG: AmmeMemoRadiSam system protein B [Bacteroidota bacterium]|nr:AmmeMemoRadiSam system protein B [Bacteroidota bacterium]
MKRLLFAFILLSFANRGFSQEQMIRNHYVDTVGFAHLPWQVDSVIQRIYRSHGKPAFSNKVTKMAICPHDDYTYAGFLYPRAIANIQAKTIILLGVAHKARLWNLENKLVFASFTGWKGPFDICKVSPYEQELKSKLNPDYSMVHDSMQIVEHSLESMIPFIQYYHPGAEIIPILVPAMSYTRMDSLATSFAASIYAMMKIHHLSWGKDLAILITTDAVHYGDEDWGGKNYAPFGTDSTGYRKAVEKEHALAHGLTGPVRYEMARGFYSSTVQENNFRDYKWTWCGRYSVPFGILTAAHLARLLNALPLKGYLQGYANSIDHDPLPVKDLRMGITAPASLHHWVGYASIVYY